MIKNTLAILPGSLCLILLSAPLQADEASDTVRRNPLAALGIAFGLGWLIGKLSRR